MTAPTAYAEFPSYRFARIGMSQSAIAALALQWAALSPGAQADQGALIASSPDAFIALIAAQFPAPLSVAVAAVTGVNPPGNPTQDQLWYNSGTDVWERWTGSAWAVAGGGGSGTDSTARAAAGTAQSTANSAQTAAATAQTSADTAQATALTAQSTASSAATGVSAEVTRATAAEAALSAASVGLTPTAVKTAPYTAAVRDLVRVDTTSASVAVTLPTSPASGAQVGVHRFDVTQPVNFNTATVTDSGGTFVDEFLPGQYHVYVWTGSAWTRPQQSITGSALSIPLNNGSADSLDRTSFYPARAGIRTDWSTRLATFNTMADVDYADSLTAVTVEATDPWSAAGSIKITSALTAGHWFIKMLANPIDLTQNNLRAMCFLDGVRSNLGRAYMDVSSDGFATANFHRYDICTTGENNTFPADVWDYAGGGQADFSVQGSGATLTAINAVRFGVIDLSTGSQYLGVAHVDSVPITATKAKCVLWFDDSLIGHWTTVYPILTRMGFRGTIAAMPATVGQMTPENLRRLQDAGWQIASHAIDSTNHVSQSGDHLRLNMSRTQQTLRAMGLRGGDDMAYWGGIGPSADVYRALRSMFRSGRNFINQSRQCETMPPTSPWRVNAWGTISGDDTSAASMIAYVDKAIAQKGLCQFVWHNQLGTAGQLALWAYLDGKRDVIDVVTFEEAIAPYLSSSPRPTLPSAATTAPTGITAFLQPQNTGMGVSWSTPTTGGFPIQSYTVMRGPSGGTKVPIATVPATGWNIYTDTGLTNGTTYDYAVRANTAGAMVQSATVSAAPAALSRGTTPASATAPATWMQAANSTPSTNGSTVTSVTDSSTNSKNWAGTFGPVVKTNALNSEPALTFNGTNSGLGAAVPLPAENLTYLIVCRMNGTTPYAANRLMGGLGNSSGSLFAGNAGVAMEFNADHRLTVGQQRQSNTASPKVDDPFKVPQDVWVILRVSVDTVGNAHVITVGINGRTQSQTPSAYTTGSASVGVGVGNVAQTNNGIGNVDVLEAVVFSTMLSDADARLWEQYLAKTHGITVQAAN